MRDSDLASLRGFIADAKRALANIEKVLGDEPVADVERGTSSSNDPTMPFGKHKGTRISKLPPDYCQWVLENTQVRSSDVHDALAARATSGEDHPHPRDVERYEQTARERAAGEDDDLDTPF